MKKAICAIMLVLAFTALQGCAGKQARLSKLNDQVCRDNLSGQMWRIEKSKQKVSSLAEAEAFIARLNQTTEYKDWRLPTIYELYELNYLIDLHQGGDCLLDRDGHYWSGKKDGDGMVGAWEIADQCDPARQYFPGGKGYVRAVRP